MKFLIIGGTGLIGSNVTNKLKAAGHEVVVGAPATGVDASSGAGVAEAMKGVEVVIDLSNSRAFDDETALGFFRAAGGHLLPAAVAAGVKHYLCLSIVGADRMGAMGYMRAKLLQEQLIKESGLPYTIIRSTQFQEFVPFIVQAATAGSEVHISTLDFQPIATEEVASFVAAFATEVPANGITEIAGPERKTIDAFVQEYLALTASAAKVVTNNQSAYMGTVVPQSALVPLGQAHLGKIAFRQTAKTIAG
ncbi:uncharacterized protein YbjT (DUF2867 family) [Filimonas zeae]|uniref:NmrA family transcriptional regulator n=1 Tax=Filimonas zeae TaxID=1737353 RepID=A0A917MXJ7_9BACT|nr:NAD(P)H-binding protein [Filimonas zeae]MDR6340654.1 uncharacterized protein YbjT (DUF2867 family) [Filimonas zeae]GGH73745.1 NmrA family transcriptional regulator [Filimonas zeae]